MYVASLKTFKRSKFFLISSDNAAANTTSTSDLQTLCQPNIGGNFFHARCACHVLNVCVRDGLKFLDVLLSLIKKVISFLGHIQNYEILGEIL